MSDTSIHPMMTGQRGGRWRQRLGCAAFCLIGLICFGLAMFFYGRRLWHSEPGYWTRNQVFVAGTDQTELNDIADRAFNRVMSELSNSSGYQAANAKDDSFGVRTIRLEFEQANAWLATRLGDWLINQKRELPPGVSQPMLSGEDGELVAAFHYKHDELDQVFSVLLSLDFLDDGRATLHVDGVRGGRLPLPTQMVLDQLPGGNGDHEKRSQTIAVLLGQQAFDPILPIDGTRQARIIGMVVDEQSVSLTVQAEPAD